MKFILGIVMLIFFFVGSIVVNAAYRRENNIDVTRTFKPPSLNHPLGTDDLGRSVLVRAVLGMTATLSFSTFVSLFTLGVGTIIGFIVLTTGHAARYVLFLNDVMLIIPDILLIFLTASVSEGNIIILATGMIIAFLPHFVMIFRALSLRLKNDEYIVHLSALGIPRYRLVEAHIFPRLLPTLLVQTFYSIGSASMILTTLGFLGIELGIRENLGYFMNSSISYFFLHPIPTLTYATCVVLVSYSCNLIGDGLKDRWSVYGLLA